MLYHSKLDMRDLVFVSEIFREDWTFIGKKSRDSNKWLGVVVAVEFSDWDVIEENYSLNRVIITEQHWRKSFKFIPEQNKYPASFIYKVKDIVYSFKNNWFKFLSESRNSIRWTNPDKTLSKYFREWFTCEQLEKLLEDYNNWFKDI